MTALERALMGTAGGPTVVGCITRRLPHDPCAALARAKRPNCVIGRPIERRACPCPDWRSSTIRTWVGMTVAVARSFRRLRRTTGNSPPTGSELTLERSDLRVRSDPEKLREMVAAFGFVDDALRSRAPLRGAA